MLHHKSNISFEYCKLQPDDICGPCLCKDDARVLKKCYCDCQNIQPKRDCLEHKQVGVTVNGVYKIHQDILKIIQVYCDQTNDGSGWTVFQRRIDESVDFFRDWEHYKQGFGNLRNEFWLGNENIFTSTLQGFYPRGNELRTDMINDKKSRKHVKYVIFHIASASTKHTLHVSDFTGDLSDRLKRLSKQSFSIFDADNDGNSVRNCGFQFCAGWWFHGANRYDANLNGFYYSGGKMGIDGHNRNIPAAYSGIHWFSHGFNEWDGRGSLSFTEMKVRRKI